MHDESIQTEQARLASLAALDILDSPAEREFDDITRLAAAALGVRSAAVSLIDANRQWFKSRHGIAFAETRRDIAFCAYALTQTEPFVVPDAAADPRFAGNPLVTAAEGIRFYAGAPLIGEDGRCVGTLCVFDPEPRPALLDSHRDLLVDLATLTMTLIQTRRARRMGDIAAKVVEASADAVLAIDRDGCIVYWNEASSRMFGRSGAEAVGERIEIIIPKRFAAGHPEILAKAAAGGTTRLVGTTVELVAMHRDGSEFPVELSLATWGQDGAEQGFAAIVRDITRRKDLERDRQNAMSFLDTVVANLPAMLFVKDAESRRYLIANQAMEKVTGRRAASIIGRNDQELFPQLGGAYEKRDTMVVEAGGAHVHESVFTRPDGSTRNLRTTRRLIDGPDKANQYILGLSEDVTEVRAAQAEVLRLANYDTLTGLFNRASYEERLSALVASGAPFALLAVDLDRFKAINDQFGHPTGDDVLAQTGERLRGAVKSNDLIARIGGDEFIIILTGDRLRERAGSVAHSVVACLKAPFSSRRAVAHTGASVGIVTFPTDGASMAQLSENADLALYRAKSHGRGTVCFFNAEMDEASRDRRKLESELRSAIEDGCIMLAYQPVVALETAHITSFEALARWSHPERGMIPPDVFIPLAEECGLIETLGAKLLQTACRDAAAWPEPLRVAVNLSPLQFLQGTLMATVQDALQRSGLTADRLQLEITEGLLIKDVERTFQQLEELRTLGIQVLLDDFGVGYSSLSYFQRFRFDKVKIDRSFIATMHHSAEARAIIEAVIGLGTKLGIGIVAEGVETAAQIDQLAALGCSHVQGFGIGRPIPHSKVVDFVGRAGVGAPPSGAPRQSAA